MSMFSKFTGIDLRLNNLPQILSKDFQVQFEADSLYQKLRSAGQIDMAAKLMDARVAWSVAFQHKVSGGNIQTMLIEDMLTGDFTAGQEWSAFQQQIAVCKDWLKQKNLL